MLFHLARQENGSAPNSSVDSRLVPSRYLRVLWGEKIRYKDGLRRAGCHGKRQRKNSDWQISIQYGVRLKSDFFFVGL